MLRAVAKVRIYYRQVRKKLRAKRRRTLYPSAAYGRVVMRSQIRPGKKSSQPNRPPKSHNKTLKNNIVFDVDLDAGEATIGVALVPSAMGKPRGGKTRPQIIDGGGVEDIVVAPREHTDRDGVTRVSPEQVVRADYEPRPILDPVAPTSEENFRKNERNSGF